MEKSIRQKLAGYNFIVRPTVFNPSDFTSSKLFISYIKTLDLKEKNILDMGAGSGVLSIVAASRGAKCIAADINPVAVRCIRENAKENNFAEQITAIESDLFESLRSVSPAKYDIIFFNPPYYKGNPGNNFERAFKGGPNLEVLKLFLKEAKNFMVPGGFLCILFSSDMDISDFYKHLDTCGYSHKILLSTKKYFETFYIIEAVISK